MTRPRISEAQGGIVLENTMDYPDWFDVILRCPETGTPLSRVQDGYVREDGLKYSITNEILSIVYPQSLMGEDAKLNHLYNRIAPYYDRTEQFFGKLITGMDVIEAREDIVLRLNIAPGVRLLEVSPGPGVFQKLLRAQLTDTGEFVSLDLSVNMLRQCQLRNANLHVHLVHANGQFLPFADNSFDVLFHFGGVNLFNDPDKAIQEFIRVVKRNGIVSWGDEGFSNSYRSEIRKRVLARLNPGFLKSMPGIPDSLLHEKKVHEVFGGLGYLVVARKN
jgi:ubiquinone/menaquinone biosynthesis C-methylase UbiE